jgi:hypothetical protein
MDTITATFIVERETKNTIRFQEAGNDCFADTPICGTLYVQKAALEELGWQEDEPLTVAITVG